MPELAQDVLYILYEAKRGLKGGEIGKELDIDPWEIGQELRRLKTQGVATNKTADKTWIITDKGREQSGDVPDSGDRLTEVPD